MKNLRWYWLGTVVAAAMLIMSATERPSRAGDGFPPFGAWAYGGGSRSHSVSSFSFVGVGPRHHGHWFPGRHLVRNHLWHPRHSGFVGFYHTGFPIASFGYSTFGCGFPNFYRTYIPSVQFPVFSAPVVFPIHHAPPLCYSTTITRPSVIMPVNQVNPVLQVNRGRSVPNTAIVGSRPSVIARSASSPTSVASSRLASSRLSAPTPATAAQTQLVSVRVDSEPPAELLESADAIFRAGGYREAGAAYARLSVNYGASDTLFARRFIAQVACNDLQQAAVIAGSAELAGYALDASSLPTGDLESLGLSDQFVSNQSEALAERAFHDLSDADAMLALGRWLGLAGDHDRSQIFVIRSQQLSKQADAGVPLDAPAKNDFAWLE